MNILLVSPKNPDTFWSFNHVLKMAGKKSAFPPLGLLTVAGMLPSDWNLRLVDLNVRALADADLEWADAVFLSAMIVHEPSVREVIQVCKAHAKPLVAGGPLFTTGAERFDEIDCCVIGEAEDIIGNIVGDLERGTLQRRYEAAQRPDVTTTPLPRWDLIDTDDYLMMSVQCSRGCPFDCEFCDITAVYGRLPRVKTPEQMVAELDAVIDTGWIGPIFVVDDNFIGNRAKAKTLLRTIIDWRSRCGARNKFITEASMNLVDDEELLRLMVDAGFNQVFIGIESPEEASLRECNKVQNTKRDLVESVRKIHQAGLQVMAGFIVGFDADRADVFERQKRFIQEAGVVTAMVGLLTALPGTRLFTRLTSEGRIVGQSTGNNLDAVLNFEPTLDRTVLVDGYRHLVKDLYAPRQYYQRVRRFLEDYRPSPASGRVSRSDIRAFLSSIWVVGIAHKGRREYWKLMAGSLIRSPRTFRQAAELAIRGHHFRLIAASL
ncbi:MAG: B12-binding domain-containing radical SAM protein [Phycisphaerales bacterium]